MVTIASCAEYIREPRFGTLTRATREAALTKGWEVEMAPGNLLLRRTKQDHCIYACLMIKAKDFPVTHFPHITVTYGSLIYSYGQLWQIKSAVSQLLVPRTLATSWFDAHGAYGFKVTHGSELWWTCNQIRDTIMKISDGETEATAWPTGLDFHITWNWPSGIADGHLEPKETVKEVQESEKEKGQEADSKTKACRRADAGGDACRRADAGSDPSRRM